MLHDIIFLILGLVLLVYGATFVTDGGVAIAHKFKVSNLMIGLTVVALGSTLPDTTVCVQSALHHSPSIAVGEVIGSNIFDLLLVIGIMGIVRPWRVSTVMRRQDLPILLIVSAALWFAGNTILFDGAQHNIISRSAGIMLILIFIFYMWLMIITAHRDKGEDDATPDNTSTPDTPAPHDPNTLKGRIARLKGTMWFSWILIVAGLGILVVGGNWVVDGASGLALKLGMSQAMVALTVVAIGNALPDLVTSLTATLKGACGIALGNIVGSCILNALLSTGLSSLIIPLRADSIGSVDFITLVGASALLWLVPSLSRSKRINRLFGVILVLLYAGYMTFTVIRG